MDRIYLLNSEKQSLITKLNNYKLLLNKTKSKGELIRLNQEIKQLNEKIESIDLIIENLKL